MPLDHIMRGILEQIIDLHIGNTPVLVSAYRSESQKWVIKNPEDFTYGYVMGSIDARFNSEFDVAKNREMNEEEHHDFFLILHNRASQIRDAIFKAG